MSGIVIILVILGAILLAVGLAFLPMNAILEVMARTIATPIREYIQRRRDRRRQPRSTPERRQNS